MTGERPRRRPRPVEHGREPAVWNGPGTKPEGPPTEAAEAEGRPSRREMGRRSVVEGGRSRAAQGPRPAGPQEPQERHGRTCASTPLNRAQAQRAEHVGAGNGPAPERPRQRRAERGRARPRPPNVQARHNGQQSRTKKTGHTRPSIRSKRFPQSSMKSPQKGAFRAGKGLKTALLRPFEALFPMRFSQAESDKPDSAPICFKPAVRGFCRNHSTIGFEAKTLNNHRKFFPKGVKFLCWRKRSDNDPAFCEFRLLLIRPCLLSPAAHKYLSFLNVIEYPVRFGHHLGEV